MVFKVLFPAQTIPCSYGVNFQECVHKESGSGKHLKVYGEQSQCCDKEKWIILGIGKHWTGLCGVADEWNLLHFVAFPSVLWDEG